MLFHHLSKSQRACSCNNYSNIRASGLLLFNLSYNVGQMQVYRMLIATVRDLFIIRNKKHGEQMHHAFPRCYPIQVLKLTYTSRRIGVHFCTTLLCFCTSFIHGKISLAPLFYAIMLSGLPPRPLLFFSKNHIPLRLLRSILIQPILLPLLKE